MTHSNLGLISHRLTTIHLRQTTTKNGQTTSCHRRLQHICSASKITASTQYQTLTTENIKTTAYANFNFYCTQ